jgi:capsular polysaccharide biosynthesis protein
MTGPGFILLVRRWWWLIGLGALVGALAAWLIASHAGKTYQADTSLLVGPVSGDFSTLHASGELGKTYAELAASRPVVQAAARSARVSLTPSEMQSAVTASSNDVTRIIDIRVRDRNPFAAARLADAVGQQLLELRVRLPVQQTDAAKTILGDPSLATLSHAQRQAVRGAVGRFGWSSTAGDLAVVESAVPSRHPVAPKVGLLVLLAALGGALAAVLWASMREAVARAPAEEEGFEFESFLPPSSNGADRDTTPAELDRWLDEPRATEHS